MGPSRSAPPTTAGGGVDETDAPAPTFVSRVAGSRQAAAHLHSPLALGALAGTRAAAAGLGLVVLPALLVWLAANGAASAPTTGEGDGWWAPLRAGGAAWLLAHGGALRVGGVLVDVVPLGLSALVALLCALAARHAASALHTAPRQATPGSLLAALGGAVASYTAVATAVSALVTSQTLLVSVVPGVLGAALLCALGSAPALLTRSDLLGFARALHLAARGRPGDRAARSTSAALVVLRRVPVAVGAALGLQLAAGLTLVLLGLLAGSERVVALHAGLSTGLVGGAALVAAQLAVLPVAAVWCLALLAGPGFAVGAGTAVTPGGVQLGALPALPLLGALPPPGALPGWVPVVVVLPVLAGTVAGAALLGRPRRREAGRAAPEVPAWWHRLAAAAAVSAVTGLLVGLLVALASGSAGPGRMGQVGADPVAVGLAVAAETGVGCLGVVLAALLLTALRAGRGRAVLPAEQLVDDARARALLAGGQGPFGDR